MNDIFDKSESSDQKEISKKNTLREEIIDFFKFLIILLLIYFLIKNYLAQPFLVKGQSMENNFHDGDYVVVDVLSYKFRDPQRFEVVIFDTEFIEEYPHKQGYYIKRIIGLPGDRVTVKDNKVTIFNSENENGLVLEEKYLDEFTVTKSPEPIDIKLEDNQYFVMGDNRDNSSDSRYWGYLPEDNILGKPFVRLYPFQDLTLYTKEVFIKDK